MCRVDEQFGIHPEILRNGVQQAEIDDGHRPGITTSDAQRLAELETEVHELRRANAILRSASAYFDSGARLPRAPIVDSHKHQFGVEPRCRSLTADGMQIAPSTYYASQSRPPSARFLRDEQLPAEIRRVHAAFVIDVLSRRVGGWQLSRSLRTDLALDVLEMGIWPRQRHGRDLADLTHHSEKGVQYLAVRYTQRLAKAGQSPRSALRRDRNVPAGRARGGPLLSEPPCTGGTCQRGPCASLTIPGRFRARQGMQTP